MSADASQFAVWLSRARQGDESARNHLFAAGRGFAAVIARVQLHRRLETKVDPSDLVQQSLLEAHRGFDDFHGQTPGDWLAWLKQIVTRNVLDADKHYRGAARRDLRREVSQAAVGDSNGTANWSPVDPAATPSQLLSGCERDLRLAEAIERLPDDYRQVILLRNVEQLPFDQVASQMDRSRGACQMLWMRAVDQLRTLLQELEP
jgi:RNA polymerase sigma-70 factor (ECF subfamily)